MSTLTTPAFPLRPSNRPALNRVGYRVGAYGDFLEAMLRQLNASPELQRWTHRAADDPGIALLESASEVADILTFYQEHYANETFLRTASWRESVQELVRLTGYRLSPALGGSATFAVEVKGTAPVVVPAKFPIKTELANVPDPVDFLTNDETTAYPQIGRFRLYRKRNPQPGLTAQVSSFEISALGGQSDPAVLQAFDLKAGDKLLLVPPAPAWLTSGTTAGEQQAMQIVKVSKVTHRLGLIIVEIEGWVEEAWASPVTAYRVNRSFRHFGHNTPPKTTYQSGSGKDMVTIQTDAHVLRHLSGTCWGSPSHLYTKLPRQFIPLDQEVNDLSVGGRVILEALLQPTSGSERKVTLARTIQGLKSLTMHWGNVSGPSTWIELASRLVTNSSFSSATSDIREFRVHEVTSPALRLRDLSEHPGGGLASNNDLHFFGTKQDAALLKNRAIFLSVPDGRVAKTTVVAVQTAGASHARMRRLTLSQIPKGFRHEDFDEAAPIVDVFGNLLEATQGKAEPVVPLGNGDARQTFQTFKLPKAPLTYLLEPEATPPETPELVVRVQGREWKRVDSFFGRGALEEIFIVREDGKGESYVQFGDGETGARLPSGINNVTLEFRSGAGALGPIKEGAKPTAGAKLNHLDKLTLAGEVTGGAPAEDEAKARRAAPGKLQSLGRLVSIQDYESEALQLGGVIAATASWEIVDGTPSVLLCILLEQAQQTDEQFAAVEAILHAADRGRGPNRHPIRVIQGELRYLYLTLTYAHDPALLSADVDAAIRSALGLVGDSANEGTGLFGRRRRRLGEKEYASRIEAAAQNVAGVRWCRVERLALLPPANDPLTLTVPAAPVKHAQVACAPTEMLQLHPAHLTLIPTLS